MKATFRLTRDGRSLAAQMSNRNAFEDGLAAIAAFRQAAGDRVIVSEPQDLGGDGLTVTLEARNPERDLATLAEQWQRALVASGMQADVVG